MKVPFVDLRIQYKSIKKEIKTAIDRVFQSSIFIGGEEVEKFENEFAKYLGVKHCVTVNSGTDALIAGLRVLDLKPDDEVIIPVNTFIATALAASQNGLKPVFVDIDEADLGINLKDLKQKITSKTKAVIVVHLFGQPDKIDEIKKIIKAAKQKIYLIEDACQAHGARYKNKKVGSFGDFAAFSFYPSKNLGAYGDGGAIITNNDRIATNLRLYREYGQTRKYIHISLGINSRLDPLQAAMLRVKLKYLDKWSIQRQKAASLYTKLLQKFPEVRVQPEFSDRKSIYHLYIVRVAKRDMLMEYLKEKGIIALIHYPLPLHLQKAYSYLNYKKGDFPIAEKVAHQLLSLPMYGELKPSQIKYVVQNIKKFYGVYH